MAKAKAITKIPGSAQPSLTPEDWQEIYYALDYKLTSDGSAAKGDRKWESHLRQIMKIIGPDGDNMTRGSELTPADWEKMYYALERSIITGEAVTDSKLKEFVELVAAGNTEFDRLETIARTLLTGSCPHCNGPVAECGGKTFISHYECSGDLEYRTQHEPEEWDDTWCCACNDKCPSCNAEIEPYKVEEA